MAQGERISLVTGGLGDGFGSGPRGKIYLCYSHQDRLLVERFVHHLRVVAKYKGISFWWDQDLEGGSPWRSEIGQAIDESSVALVMVSTGLLNSSDRRQLELRVDDN